MAVEPSHSAAISYFKDSHITRATWRGSSCFGLVCGSPNISRKVERSNASVNRMPASRFRRMASSLVEDAGDPALFGQWRNWDIEVSDHVERQCLPCSTPLHPVDNVLEHWAAEIRRQITEIQPFSNWPNYANMLINISSFAVLLKWRNPADRRTSDVDQNVARLDFCPPHLLVERVVDKRYIAEIQTIHKYDLTA